MARRALATGFVIALFGVAGHAGCAHWTHRSTALAVMASRSRAAGRVHRTRVRVLRWRMATGAVPLWRMVFGVARCARALHRSLARVRVARGALQPAVALMRKRHWPGTRLLPDRKRECRGY